MRLAVLSSRYKSLLGKIAFGFSHRLFQEIRREAAVLIFIMLLASTALAEDCEEACVQPGFGVSKGDFVICRQICRVGNILEQGACKEVK